MKQAAKKSLYTEEGMSYVCPKYRIGFNGPHGAISQMTKNSKNAHVTGRGGR
jgi:hypothetical protein